MVGPRPSTGAGGVLRPERPHERRRSPSGSSRRAIVARAFVIVASTLARLRTIPASAIRPTTSASPKPATTTGSNPANASRKAGRLRRIVAHDNPDSNASSDRRSNRPARRAPASPTPCRSRHAAVGWTDARPAGPARRRPRRPGCPTPGSPWRRTRPPRRARPPDARLAHDARRSVTIGTSGGAATRTAGPHAPAPREVTTVGARHGRLALEHRLLRRREVVDGHVAAVRVARQLQVDPTPLDRRGLQRLVGREQREATGMRAAERCVVVGRPLALAVGVVHPGQSDRRTHQRRSGTAIWRHGQPDVLEGRDPVAVSRNICVVACGGEHAQRRLEAGQRADLGE